MYSDQSGDYTRDYVSADDADMPAYNVFTRRDGVIRHFWSDEITGDMADPGQDPRGAVEMDPLWLLLDTIPGRPRRRLAPQPDVLTFSQRPAADLGGDRRDDLRGGRRSRRSRPS